MAWSSMRSSTTEVTTDHFSTFEYETLRLTEGGALWWGGLNVIASVAAGFAAVQLGVFLAR
jgi:fluoride ion exporter CrcB/FEX